MVIGASLEHATTIDGRRRFYAPGRHPATYRDRVMVEKLLALWRIPHPGDDSLREAIVYHRHRVEEFERNECLEKARYIEAMEPFHEATMRVVERLREEAGVEAAW